MRGAFPQPVRKADKQRASAPEGCSQANRFHIRRVRVGKIPALKVERQIDQGNHHRHLDQRPNHGREGRAGVDAEYGNRYGDRQFEVIRRR